MFIGHFALGMAGKKIQPAISLGTLFLAAQFLDLLWPTLLLLDIEHVVIIPGTSSITPLEFTDYPISHSLVMVLAWSLIFGVTYYVLTKNKRGAILLGSLVLSHWILDLLVHLPDLPLYPGNAPKVGMGLWNSLILTILVEGLIFIFGVWIYVRTKKELGQKITGWFWSMIALLVMIHISNFMAPPPPTVEAIAWAGHLQWLFILWAWWADRVKS